MITDLNSPTREGMKFFTPELYLQFQSEDDAVATAAQEAWEGRIEAYSQHLRGLLKRDRESAFTHLAELRLHDYLILDYGRDLLGQGGDDDFYFFSPARERGTDNLSRAWPSHVPFTIRLKGSSGYLTLAYFVWAHVAVKRAQGWRTQPTNRTFWLYDELDLAWPGTYLYVHRILRSDGEVLMIPFTHAEVVGDGAPVANPNREARDRL